MLESAIEKCFGKKVFKGWSRNPKTSKMVFSAKTVNGFQLSTIVAKSSILDVAGFQCSRYSLSKVSSVLETNYSEVDPETLSYLRSAIHNMPRGVLEITVQMFWELIVQCSIQKTLSDLRWISL